MSPNCCLPLLAACQAAHNIWIIFLLWCHQKNAFTQAVSRDQGPGSRGGKWMRMLVSCWSLHHGCQASVLQLEHVPASSGLWSKQQMRGRGHNVETGATLSWRLELATEGRHETETVNLLKIFVGKDSKYFQINNITSSTTQWVSEWKSQPWATGHLPARIRRLARECPRPSPRAPPCRAPRVTPGRGGGGR